ncbi:MAG: hypothetical protein WAL59_06595, partial [Roseiarcus sp.]
DEDGAHLCRISDGLAQQVTTMHLGVGFEQYQQIRHRAEIDAVPLSFGTLMTTSVGVDPPPKGLKVALKALLKLFVERVERDVGGFAVPFFLTRTGCMLLLHTAIHFLILSFNI